MFSPLHRNAYRLLAKKHEDVPPSFPSFFIISAGRSGSTLVSRDLATEKGLHMLGESHGAWLKFMALYFKGKQLKSPWTVQSLKNLLVHEEPSGITRLLLDYLDRSGLKDVLPSPEELLKRTLGLSSNSMHPLIGEKSPLLATELALVTAFFPKAKFIVLFRDPRDVIESFHRTKLIVNPEEALRRWVKVYTQSLKLSQADPEKWLFLPYENWVKQPRVSKNDLISFLDPPQDTEPLGNLPSFDLSLAADHHRKSFQPISENWVGQWKSSEVSEKISHLYTSKVEKIHMKLFDRV